MGSKSAILIVDDERMNRELLKNAFRQDYELLEAQNGEEALRILHEQTNVAVVALDLMMPQMDGFEVLRRIGENETLKAIPVVVMTAAADEEAQVRAFRLGAQDVVVKPFNARLVQARVHSLLERRKAEAIAKENELMRLSLEKQNEILRLAEIDEKTGLDNQQTFCRKVSAILRDEPQEKHLIVRWDVDRFKVLNDIFGLAEGDRLLRAIGDVCREFSSYPIARLDADHFVCCLPKERFDSKKQVKFAVRFLSDFNPNYELTPRFGVYEVDDPGLDVHLMCDRALLALRSIKGSYTHRVAWYDDAMRNAMLNEQEILGQMEGALADGQFQVYLQPQFDHADGAMIGAEALVRWIHPQRGVISPGAFIPLFERSGFINKLDESVWEQTCRLLRRWLDMGLPVVPLSVNISRRDAYNPLLCDLLLGLLEKYELHQSLLRLEITESAYVENPEMVIAVTKKLRDNGFYVEMDDFGSGYSSLNSLKDMPVNMLKLDMRFIATGVSNDRCGIILSSVVRMAMWLGISVLAEGVETVKQADYLKTIGCGLMQGYLYARPMPADEFEQMLKTKQTGGMDDRFLPSSLFNSKEFWDPEAQAAVIFNSFVGAAGIFELCGDNAELLRANDGYYRLLHLPDRLSAQNVTSMLDFSFEEDKQIVLHTAHLALQTDGETSCTSRWHNLRYPGGVMWLHTRVRVIARGRDRNAFYAAFDDVTDLKRTSLELEKQRMSLQNLYDTIPCGIVQYLRNKDGVYVLSRFNDEAMRIFGYHDRAEVEGREDAMLYMLHAHSDDLELVSQNAQRIKRDNSSCDFNCRVIGANCEMRWLRVQLRHLISPDGTALIQAVYTDITAQKDAELELYSRSLFAIYDEVYYLDGSDGTSLLRFSRDAQKPLNVKHDFEELLSVWCAEHVDEPTRERMTQFFRLVGHMKESEAETLEYSFTRGGGAVEWATSTLVCVGGENYLLGSRVVTAQREAERLAAENAALRFAMLERNADDERNRLFMEHSGVLVADYTPTDAQLTLRRRLEDGSVDVKRMILQVDQLVRHGILHEDSRERVHNLVETVKRRATRGNVEFFANLYRTGFRLYRMDYVSIADPQGAVYRVVGILSDIQEEKDASDVANALSGRLGIAGRKKKETLSDQVFRLLYETTDLQGSVGTVLEVFGKQSGASRVYIVEDDGDGVHCTNTFEWRQDGAMSLMEKTKRHVYPTGSLAGYLKLFGADDMFACDDLSKLPSDVRDMFASFGIRSLAQFAVFRDGRFVAAIGFDDCVSPNGWSREQLDMLQMVSRRIGMFMAGKRTTEQG